MSTNKYEIALGNLIVQARESDGYINATQLCKAGNKKFAQWFMLESTKALIKALELNVGCPTFKLIEVKVGRYNSGSWIHPDLAVQLAQWISPEFAIRVSRWVREIFYTGAATVESKSHEELLELARTEVRDQIDGEWEMKVNEMKREYETRELRMKDFINRTKKIDKEHVIYIGTCDAYNRQNRYKVGGCKSVKLLKSRFATYNSRSAEDDKFVCIYYRHVHDYLDIEKRVSALLAGFKETNKEFYHIHGESLKISIDFIIDNADRDIEWFNDNLPTFTSQLSTHTEPMKLQPIHLDEKRSLYLTTGEDSSRVEVCDITGWNQEKIDEEIDYILNMYKTKNNVSSLDGEVVNWKEIAELIKERYKGTRMMPWRGAFKSFIPRRSERLLIKGLGK